MSRLGDVLAALKTNPPASAHALVPFLERAGKADDATKDEVSALLDICAPYLHGGITPALGMLRSLLKSGDRPGAFPFLHTPTIVCQALWRLFDPGSLDQKKTGLCGPTAFVVDLCRQRPVEYAGVLVNLAVSGRAKLNGLEIDPSSNIRFRNPSQIASMAQVDWIMVASLRDCLTGMNIYGVMSLFQDVEQVGISPDALFDWLCRSGYGSVALLGRESLVDAVLETYANQAVLTKRVHGHRPPGFDDLPLSRKGAAQLAQIGSDNDWSVFLIADTALSDGLDKGMVNFDAVRATNLHFPTTGQTMPGHGNALTVETYAMKELNEARKRAATQGKAALAGASVGGHVMCIAEFKIGHYVSITAFNYGKLVYNHHLPADAVYANIRCVIIATDRIG